MLNFKVHRSASKQHIKQINKRALPGCEGNGKKRSGMCIAEEKVVKLINDIGNLK